ncbi:acyltransferase [Mycobacterium sp. ITM-2016-00317]|uniref:acyltransferase family protein n=1 Tax=Mycobacterium sp. ITM-2016-00317 TaxID=2099694 RepID=UPI000D3F1E28|nr:acyltransferase [Mycobacterium sp. ITM-2016-00317]WNG86181.1 acyltransferase [Mycobacterium sp. ITM-2016-00317]
MALAVSAAHGEQPASAHRYHRPDVQGLRAIAVLVVILDHVGMPGFAGGFVGVDVFFVISGYVITGMLLRKSTQPRGAWSFDFLDFYARRARRIVPAATLVIVLTVIATFELTNFLRGARVLPDATASSLFLANFHFIATGTDYARLGADPSPLQHYWSLAVEEQFYLVWPLLVILAIAVAARWRRATLRRVLFGLLVAIVAGSYLSSIVTTSVNGVAAFYSPLTRAWELAIGCLIAVAQPWLAAKISASTALATSLSCSGVAAIAWSVLSLDDTSRFPGWVAVVPVLGAAAILVAGMSAQRTVPAAVLGNRAFGYVGDISYSLYLVHWPIFVITAARIGDDFALPVQLLLIGATFAAAAVMYHAFEDPIRRSRALVTRPWLSLAIIPASIAVVFAVAAFERYRWSLPVPLVQQLF